MSCAVGLRHAVRAFVVLAGLGLAGPARAEVSAEQAAALQQQLQDWVAGWGGGSVDFAGLPVSIVAEGERYRVSMGEPTLRGLSVSGGAVSAFATPLEGGRWAVDELRWPATLEVTSPNTTPAWNLSVSIAEQAGQGVFDPSLATESSMDGRLNGVVYRFDGAVGTITTRFRTISSHTIWQPSGGGLLSMLGRTEIEGYERTQRLATGKTSSTTIDRIHADTRADRTDTARLGALVRASAAMIAAAPPPAAAPGARPMPPSVAQREAMHALTATLGGLLANLDTEQTMEGLQFHSQAFGARIARLELASGIGAPDGAAQIYLRIALQDFESDDIPEGPFRQLLPRRLLLTPRVSGVAKEALLRFLDAAIDASGRPDAQAAATAAWLTMLAGSPATFAIDELALETGTASLTGSMEVEVRSASDVTGGADLRLTGLDALIGLAAANPQLQQAMPVLIILKGIGRQDGAATVWKVAYAGQKVTVNGTDLSALIPRK